MGLGGRGCVSSTVRELHSPKSKFVEEEWEGEGRIFPFKLPTQQFPRFPFCSLTTGNLSLGSALVGEYLSLHLAELWGHKPAYALRSIGSFTPDTSHERLILNIIVTLDQLHKTELQYQQLGKGPIFID